MADLRGHLLIASPKLLDPNFFRTVVQLVQHDEHGAMGLILNRPMGITIQTAWKQVSQTPCLAEGLLHEGGPCEGPLMVLHTDTGLSQIQFLPGICFSTSSDEISRLVAHPTGLIKFFVGYAGWTPGQLEKEIAEGAWLAVPGTAERIFHATEDQWADLHRALANAHLPAWVNPKLIPDDPSVN